MAGSKDTTTIVTDTIMIWYTKEFAATFASKDDMEVFVDLIFEETNQGYINSGIPVGYHCVKMSSYCCKGSCHKAGIATTPNI